MWCRIITLAMLLGWANLPAQERNIHSMAQQEGIPSFRLENPKNLEWEPKRATRLYWYVSAQVARSLNPQTPKDLRPIIILKLGEEKDRAHTLDGVTTISLKEWNANKWAYAVAVAALAQALSAKELELAATHGFIFAEKYAPISVEDLQKPKSQDESYKPE